MGLGFQFGKIRVLEMDCTVLWLSLLQLNCTLENGSDG